MPSITRVSAQIRAAAAPHTASHATSFRDRDRSDFRWKHSDLPLELAIQFFELLLGDSTAWLSYPIVPNCGSF